MLERAAPATEGRAAPPWKAASGPPRVLENVRGAPDTWRTWGGGARRAAVRPVRLGARRPTRHRTK